MCEAVAINNIINKAPTTGDADAANHEKLAIVVEATRTGYSHLHQHRLELRVNLSATLPPPALVRADQSIRCSHNASRYC